MENKIYESNSLMHFLKKGEKRENHKYIERIGTSPNYKYFYTQAAYDAYMKFQNATNKFNQAGKSLQTTAKKYSLIGQQFLSNLIGNTKSTVSKANNVKSEIAKKAKVSVNVAKNVAMNKLLGKSVAYFINKKTSIVLGKDKTDTENKNTNIEKNKKVQEKLPEKAKKVLDSWMKDVSRMLEQVNKPNPKSKSELKKKEKTMSPDNDMKRVNPYYLEDYSFSVNCVNCSTAYNMRRMGYDVEADDYHHGVEPGEGINTFAYEYSLYTHNNANTNLASRVKNFIASFSNNQNTKQKAIKEAMYPGATFEYADDSKKGMSKTQIDKIEKEILSQGEGARGCFVVEWTNGGGHSVVYEVENGKAILRDCQSNQVLSIEDYAKISKTVRFFRTDNEDITDEALKCVKNKSLDTINFGKSGKEKTTPYALASKYEQNGYKYSTIYHDGELFYKVYISENQCLYIDENGLIEYGNSDKW